MISRPTRDRVLERLGIDSPAPTIDGLRDVYGAWCRQISFDNVQKRISLVEQHDHLAGGEPEEFFENFLLHRTGGVGRPALALEPFSRRSDSGSGVWSRR